jgi:DNA-binding response OmpR family regulator
MQYDGRSSKIVVAESERTILEMLQMRLDVAGYHPITARTGADALEVLRNTRPDALLLDLNLPDIRGTEILLALKREPGRVQIPVLVTGRNLGVDDIRDAIALGARDCLVKPYSGADILDRISRMLKRQAPAPAVSQRYVYC